MRVDFTPAWLSTAVSALKYTDKADGAVDLTTLKEAEAARARVCVPGLSFLGELVWNHIPEAEILFCDSSGSECVDLLKSGACSMFSDDALLLHYIASQDATLEVTRERFRSQYMVWPMKKSLEAETSTLINKWMYAASNNGTVDELYHKYFSEGIVSYWNCRR